MGTLDRHWRKIVVLVIFVSLSAFFRHRNREASPETKGLTADAPSLLGDGPAVAVKESEVPFEELSEMEQHKQMDIANMKKIHAALMAYKKETDLASLGAIPAPPGVVGRGKPKVDIDAEMARRGHAEVIHRVVVR